MLRNLLTIVFGLIVSIGLFFGSDYATDRAVRWAMIALSAIAAISTVILLLNFNWAAVVRLYRRYFAAVPVVTPSPNQIPAPGGPITPRRVAPKIQVVSKNRFLYVKVKDPHLQVWKNVWYYDELFLIFVVGIYGWFVYSVLWHFFILLVLFDIPPGFLEWPYLGWIKLVRDVLVPICFATWLVKSHVRRVTPATIWVRQFLGRYRVFTDTMTLYFGWMSGVVIPGSERITMTPDINKPNAITSQILIRNEKGKFDRTIGVFVSAQIQWRLAIVESPANVVLNWIDDFLQNGTEKACANVERLIIELVAGLADEFLQTKTVDELLAEREKVNKDFLDHVYFRLFERGIIVDAILIVHAGDIEKGGYIESRQKAAESTARSDQQKLTALREQEAATARIAQNLLVQKSALDAQLEVLELEAEVLVQAQTNEEQRAKNNLQPQMVLLEAVKDKDANHVLRARMLTFDSAEATALSQFSPKQLTNPTLVLGETALALLNQIGKNSGDGGNADSKT